MKSKIVCIVAIVFSLLVVISCYGTVVTPPQNIQVDEKGNWTFTIAVDQADMMTGSVILPANTTKEFENGTKILTKNTVQIDFTPQKAYLKRALKLMDINDRLVAPAVYFGYDEYLGTLCGYDKTKGINPTIVNIYTWAETGWQKYTVFDVKAIVNGEVVGHTSFNTEKGTKTISIPTDNGTILIKNLGRLEGDYTEPQPPSDAVIFDGRYIYGGDALQYIKYDHGRTIHPFTPNLVYIENSESFSTYWWGESRWNPNGNIDDEVKATPAPYTKPGATGADILPATKGWIEKDNPTGLFGVRIGTGRMPVTPNIYPENGSSSLIEYLNMKTSGGDIAKTWLSGYDWNLDYQNGKPNAVIVDLPWGAYSGVPLVTCYVPSELAGTWVYHPPIANVKIAKAYWLNTSDIADNATCRLELYQNSNILSSATILAETTNNATVSPRSSTITMEPNTTMTLDFEIRNLGVDEDSAGTVSFAVKRTWDGQDTDNTTLTYMLLKPVVPKNVTDIIENHEDIGPTKKDSIPEYHEPLWPIAAIVCVAAITVAGMTLYARNKKYRETTNKIAKNGVNIAKAIVRPFYKRNPGATTACIVGAVIFFGLLLNMKWFPWFRFLPIDGGIPFIWECHSDWFWVFGIPASFITMMVGFWKLLASRTPKLLQQPLQTFLQQAIKTATKGTKSLSDYLQKED